MAYEGNSSCEMLVALDNNYVLQDKENFLK